MCSFSQREVNNCLLTPVGTPMTRLMRQPLKSSLANLWAGFLGSSAGAWVPQRPPHHSRVHPSMVVTHEVASSELPTCQLHRISSSLQLISDFITLGRGKENVSFFSILRFLHPLNSLGHLSFPDLASFLNCRCFFLSSRKECFTLEETVAPLVPLL